MTDGTEVFKWEVHQTYMRRHRSVRVIPVTREEHSEAFSGVERQGTCSRLIGHGKRLCVVRDYFDDEGEARAFADRCWRQG
jgi:hypothetical protein